VAWCTLLVLGAPKIFIAGGFLVRSKNQSKRLFVRKTCRLVQEIDMFADALPPRTYWFDWHMAGWPASWIVPCALFASLIALFLVVARRARPKWTFLTLLLCVFLFVVADYVVYEVGYHNQHLWRIARDPPRHPDSLEPKETPFVKPTK
jgi:hypothetical protein